MLMLLDSSLESLDFQNDLNACSAIENLLGAVFSGCHILTGDPKVIDSLLQKKESFSIRSQSVLLEIRNRLPQYGALFNRIKTRAHVCANISNSARVSENEWEIPLNAFIDISKVNKALLLTEDQVDAEIYMVAAEHFRVLNKIRGVIVSGRPEGGGGSRIAKRFENIATEELDICLCITDSDRFSPTAIPGFTSRECTKIAEVAGWAVRHRATLARELENLLPHKFIDQTIQHNNFQHAQTWEDIRIKLQADSNLVSYIDLKEGTRLDWVLKMAKGSPDRNYWMDVSKKLGITASNSECMRRQLCDATEDICECSLIDGLGPKIAESVLEWLKVTSDHKSLECVDDEVDTEWLKIGEEVFEWCCAWQTKRC